MRELVGSEPTTQPKTIFLHTTTDLTRTRREHAIAVGSLMRSGVRTIYLAYA